MKILQVIGTTSQAFGGTSEVFLQLCNSLKNNGLDLEIATTDYQIPGEKSARYEAAGVKYNWFRHDFSDRWQFSFSFKNWMRKNCRKYDIIHCHSIWSYLPSAAAKVATAYNVPYAISPHGMLSPYTFSRKPVIKKIAWLLSQKNYVKHASCFFVSSGEEEVEVKRVAGNANCYVIPHGLPTEAFTTVKEPDFLANKFSLNKMCTKFLFFSRLHPKKGLLDILLPALSKVDRDYCLFIAGNEDDRSIGYLYELKEFVSKNQLEKKVVFLGYVNPSDKWKYFDSVDWFLLPSQAENFGVVVIESMARGTPVVISDEVQAMDWVIKANGGYVLPRAVDKWTLKLTSLIDGETRLRPKIDLNWDKIGKKYKEIYSSIIRRRI